MALLNLHLGAMSEIVIKHGGTIDEFIGDAILALFGAPLAAEDDARRALACAVEMQQAMEGVNARARALSLPEMGMGIGVHTGEVVVGNIGSEQRAKYGVVGAAINLASRIQGFTLGGQILASEETLRAAGAEISVGARFSVQAKGFRDPVSIVEVLGVGEARLAPASDTLTLLDVARGRRDRAPRPRRSRSRGERSASFGRSAGGKRPSRRPGRSPRATRSA